jgi:hypothetical protein
LANGRVLIGHVPGPNNVTKASRTVPSCLILPRLVVRPG